MTQRHFGAWKVTWEMPQLGRRAGAADIDPTSHPPGELALLSSSPQGFDEEDTTMFESRAATAPLPRRIGWPNLTAFY